LDLSYCESAFCIPKRSDLQESGKKQQALTQSVPSLGKTTAEVSKHWKLRFFAQLCAFDM